MQEILIYFSDHFRPIIQQEVRTALHEFQVKLETPKDEKLYTRKETASRLSVSLVTLNKFVNEGRIQAHRVGIRVLFKAEDINNCLSKIKVRGGANQ